MDLRQEGYWDRHYELELQNYNDDGDEGEVWFGRGLGKRIAEWISNRLQAQKIFTENKIRIIDVGCGNSLMLITLRSVLESGLNKSGAYEIKLLGIDYSENSVGLSRKILDDKQHSDSIKIHQCDFLSLEDVDRVSQAQKFDVIVDKGTYDAICLLAGDSTQGLIQRQEKYFKSLYSLAKEGTIFLLASCNHTEDELEATITLCSNPHFTLKKIDRIETPKIQFGGKVGSQVTCLAMLFVKRDLCSSSNR